MFGENHTHPVLLMQKNLQSEAQNLSVEGVFVHTYASPSDMLAWLGLRNSVFQPSRVAGRPWDVEDFRREFLDKPGWNPGWMWFARTAAGEEVGAVALSRARAEGAAGHIQWLMVAPAWRRQGVARALMAALERAAWRAGIRQLRLETLAAWTEAVAFYRAIGYQ